MPSSPVDILAIRVQAPPFGGPAAEDWARQHEVYMASLLSLIIAPKDASIPTDPAEFQKGVWCGAWWPQKTEENGQELLVHGRYNSGWVRYPRVIRRIGEAHKACVACNEVHEGVPLGRHCLSY